ncbi:MAG TPA: RNA polymerase sigma factor [Longimicrobiaceae bacterium]
MGLTRAELEAGLEEHHAASLGWALSCCGWDRGEAEDVLQSSYLKVLDGRARFGARSSFRTWLFGVIRRTAAEHRRRAALRRLWLPLARADGAVLRDAAPDPASALERTETSTRLVAALRMLPRRQRETLHLVFYEELTLREAAEVLGVTIGAARQHYDRGKRRLRELLDPENRP